MVYTDYDEDDQHGFDERKASVGNVPNGRGKARTMNTCLKRKCFGIPVLYLGLLLLLALFSIGLIISGTSSGKHSSNKATAASDVNAPTTPPPTPAPTEEKDWTAHPTLKHNTDPTVAPTSYPTHESLGDHTDWVQLGNDVGGIDAPGSFGISVGVSGDGRVFAEGAHQSVGGSPQYGHVRVFAYNRETHHWDVRGSELLGAKKGDGFGFAIDLSRSGDQIAIGAPNADRHGSGPDHGYFSVHRWNETLGDWFQMGSDKWGVDAYENAGHDVTISEDGGVLVIGAPGNGKNGVNSGEIRVFFYIEKTNRWMRHGQDLKGEWQGDRFGTSVAVSDDGKIVVAGAPFSNDKALNAGHVRIFQYGEEAHHTRFHKKGHTLTGRDPDDNFGTSVACSGDGSMIAVGAPSAPKGVNKLVGYVDVYKWHEDEGKHMKFGHTIKGELAFEQFGSSVELSEDGETLIVGAPQKKDSRGSIRVFQYDKTVDNWIQVGEEILGDGDYDYFGSAVAVSANGQVIISGGNNYEGRKQGTGHVRAYRAT